MYLPVPGTFVFRWAQCPRFPNWHSL